MEELLALPVSVELRTVARALAIGKNKAYEYAAAGQFPGEPPLPVHKYGGEWRVTRPNLFRHLGLEPDTVAGRSDVINERPGISSEQPPPAASAPGALSADDIRVLYDALLAAARVLAKRPPVSS